ncbi:MAG: hypothetical protein HY805_06255 [Nitrospirae bacterium]|nr:hypothetical protein [Nitrospirota bacterium]
MAQNSEITSARDEIKRLRAVIRELTLDLESMLRLRGFRVYKKEPKEDLLLPEETFRDTEGVIDPFYEMLKKYSFRLFLRDVIKHQESFRKANVTKYATGEVTEDYINYLLRVKLIEPLGEETFRLKKRPIKSFGETLEWFVSELFKREFLTETMWGVRFKRPKVGGDYDLIAKINSSILYMEVKSSPPKQIYANEITAFMDRIEDLQPSIAIFLMDTELRMKDKIVPMFEEELKKRYPEPPRVLRLHKELFHIGYKIFIINTKDTITGNIETVLSSYFRRKG